MSRLYSGASVKIHQGTYNYWQKYIMFRTFRRKMYDFRLPASFQEIVPVEVETNLNNQLQSNMVAVVGDGSKEGGDQGKERQRTSL